MRRAAGYWQVAAVYALSFGATALFFTHLNQFLLDAGFSGAEIGNMHAVANLGGLFVVPLLSSLADRSGAHRRVLRLALLLEGAAVLAVGLGSAWLLIAVGVVVARSIMRLDVAVRDRLTLHWLNEQGSQAYGSLRLWGSLGFALMALGGGALAEVVGAQRLFMLAALLVLTVILVVRVFPARLPTGERAARGVVRLRALLKPSAWRSRLPSPALAVILVTVVLAALAVSATFGWSYALVEYELGGGKSTVGVYSSLAALVEIPLMLAVDRLLRRWGAARVWIIGMLLWSGAFLLLSLAQTPWQGVLVGVLVGVAQGFTIVTPVVYVGQVSRPDNTAFNLALIGVFQALGMTVASPVMGTLYDTAGVRIVVRTGAGLMVLAVLALAGGSLLVRRRSGRSEPQWAA